VNETLWVANSSVNGGNRGRRAGGAESPKAADRLASVTGHYPPPTHAASGVVAARVIGRAGGTSRAADSILSPNRRKCEQSAVGSRLAHEGACIIRSVLQRQGKTKCFSSFQIVPHAAARQLPG
jgi:hypothetical protein